MVKAVKAMKAKKAMKAMKATKAKKAMKAMTDAQASVKMMKTMIRPMPMKAMKAMKVMKATKTMKAMRTMKAMKAVKKREPIDEERKIEMKIEGELFSLWHNSSSKGAWVLLEPMPGYKPCWAFQSKRPVDDYDRCMMLFEPFLPGNAELQSLKD